MPTPGPATRPHEASTQVAIVHDYLTQRGGAERVVLSMLSAFPGAPVYTSLLDPAKTFPEFLSVDVHTSVLNRSALLRRRHRLAFPLLAPTFSRTLVESEVTLCSSSGWAHGVKTSGHKIVYCHTPARWLYQGDAYLGNGWAKPRGLALRSLAPLLREWDVHAAAEASRYLANSTAVRDRIRCQYGRDAEVLPPPPTMRTDDPQRPVERLEPGYWLCVARLLPYKNVDAVVEAFSDLPGERLAVVGTGPQQEELRRRAWHNVRFLGSVADDQLRWLYANCRGLVAASYEDFGLTPLEAAVFGKPSVVLGWGGFLDTVEEGRNGTFFTNPQPPLISGALRLAAGTRWSASDIQAHAERFNQERFSRRLATIVEEELHAQ